MNNNWTERMLLPPYSDLNTGLVVPTPRFMIAHVGDPRNGNYSDNCQPPTNEDFRAHLVTANVGPFSVEGHHLFLRALRAGFDEISQGYPGFLDAVGTAGCLCCRWIRGAEGSISNHSFGCAIDLKVGGILVPLGADWCTHGHLIIYRAMHKQGIFWGGGYHTRKDPMHFEASESLVSSWGAQV